MRSTGSKGAGSAAVLVRNADRMMTSAKALPEGIEVHFADGAHGVIPFANIPEVENLAGLSEIELPDPYQMILRNSQGESVELPWDFARYYCDPSYGPRIEAVAARGRRAMGDRIRQFRAAAHMTQEELASAAGIGRVTLVRIENGDQSPRYETLLALADALGVPLVGLLTGDAAA